MPNGRPTDRGSFREPVAIAVGETELKLLELVLKPGRLVAVADRVDLAPPAGEPPSPVDHVRRRLGHEELTTVSRGELPGALRRIVDGDPARFLRFFNESPSVSRRFHLLELLPGIGKKTMQAIVDERRRGPFQSFEELGRRMHLKEPQELIVDRIEAEMIGSGDKYRLFVAP